MDEFKNTINIEHTYMFFFYVPPMRCHYDTYLQNCLKRQELFSAMIPGGHQPLVSGCQPFLS